MELNYDWKSFQTLFYSKKKSFPRSESLKMLDEPVYLVLDKKIILSILCETDDFSDWIGKPVEAFQAEFLNRNLVLFDHAQLDQWTSQIGQFQHFYDQMQFIQSEAKRTHSLDSKLFQNHFLLQLTQSGWKQFFPNHYGIFIQLDQEPKRSILLIFQKGKLISFQVPDLSSMIQYSRKDPKAIVQHLKEEHLVPIQGLFLTSQEWSEWSESPLPWKKILARLRNMRPGKNRFHCKTNGPIQGELNTPLLTPRPWGILFLIFCKAYFGRR